jgi:hypothetical protein
MKNRSVDRVIQGKIKYENRIAIITTFCTRTNRHVRIVSYLSYFILRKDNKIYGKSTIPLVGE